ncbi:MAG: hypothetical protein UT63_C0053G0005 [Candidatus Gottesmanbacteria bacterium GW2011_GWC2_39_8]|uniref:Polymerase nucleotidyl transferase domain-containing protein n=1 Tax=Candidatus Gottesmanbacteria bacterium GW2011_GWC2_39_8 TaxID=1618450 RepID=A0A0G0PV59_9BACT|nr:MAG: hypothetical protein UT63_C0053G0005 [Candidatus Gottesmanbacteria bacterium GW2011_GWC2_39_8]
MAKKKYLNHELEKEVRIYLKDLRKEGISYSEIILFGSYAKGTAKPWSDIDLCVVSDQFGKDRYSERLKLMHIKNENTLDIEPHPYNLSGLEDKWDPLAVEIRKYGVNIV